MDKLPNEMLLNIFQNVDQVDQLLNCKIVCKKWYSIIDQMIRLNSLVISRINGHKLLTSEEWFDPNESIQFLYDYRYKVEDQHSKIIRFNMNQPLFSRLKKLFIYDRYIWIDSINCLKHLEVLCLKHSTLRSETDISLNLPNLRVFSCVSKSQHKLILNCPNLEKLDYYKESIIHPESIKELHACFNRNFMLDLVNCEYLYLEFVDFYSNILLKLKKLKELHLGIDVDVDSVISYIIQKKTLKRTNLKIYYLNVLADSMPLTYLNELDNSFAYERSINNNSIQFYGLNYSNLSNIVYFIRTVDYNVLENYFWSNPNQIAREITKKLVNLDELILSDQIRDVNQFIGILKDRRYLNRVSITAKIMPQHFFDQILSENCSIIEQLIVYNKNQLNFDFLLKFKELQTFHTKQQLTSDLILKMFGKFELLDSLEFNYEGREVEIGLQVRNKFKIRLDGVRKVLNNLDDLMSHLEISHHNTPFRDDCFDNFIFRS